jgi:hypothetical protein
MEWFTERTMESEIEHTQFEIKKYLFLPAFFEVLIDLTMGRELQI